MKDAAATLTRDQLDAGGLDLVEAGAHAFQIALASIGQQQPLAHPFEQFHAQKGFQTAYLLADGALRHMQFARRYRETAVPRGRFEGHQFRHGRT